MSEKFYRFKNLILSSASKLYKFCGGYLLVLFVFFIIGFITGIMTCSNYIADISCDNLINKYLCSFLKKESGNISFFLILSVYYLLISLFAIFFTRNRFFFVINIVILILTSYIFGFDLCIIISCLGLSGVILGVLTLGFIGILVFITLMIIVSIASKRCKEKRTVCQTYDNNSYTKLYLLFIILGIALIFLMIFLFSIIHIFVIVD